MIPVELGLLDAAGNDLPLQLAGEDAAQGTSRVLSVTEVTGMGDNVISTQELYRHETFTTPDGEEKDRWNWLGIHPHTPKLAKMRTEARNNDPAPGDNDGGGFWSRRR